MRSIILATTLCAGTIGFESTLQAAPKTPKALVIMLDGARADILEAAATPNLHRLIDGSWQAGYRGAYADNAQAIPDAPPNSAPNHVAIATGVTAAKHKVPDNGATAGGDYEHFPLFLAHIKRAQPEARLGYFFAWGESGQIGDGGEEIPYRLSSDEEVVKNTVEFLQGDMDAALVYINRPDEGGHGHGFYPHQPNYLEALVTCDRWIGEMLAAIAARPNFVNEDWLIIVTADHGGYHTSHGMAGGNAATIPMIIAGREVQPGRLPGSPGNIDAPVTALAHFGIDKRPLNLDGDDLRFAATPSVHVPLKEGLLYHLNFDTPEVINLVNQNEMPRHGSYVKSGVANGRFRNALELPRGDKLSEYVELVGSEKLPETFTLAFWALLPDHQLGDALLVANKDWQSGANPGVAVIAAKTGPGADTPGVMLNYGREDDRKRGDLGQFDREDAWMFFAVTRDAQNVVRFYQGSSSGTLYWISEDAGKMAVNSGMSWKIGQDGTGQYPFNFGGKVDDLAMWNRALPASDIRSIFESGRQGIALSGLL